jgi:hypothetical protein
VLGGGGEGRCWRSPARWPAAAAAAGAGRCLLLQGPRCGVGWRALPGPTGPAMVPINRYREVGRCHRVSKETIECWQGLRVQLQVLLPAAWRLLAGGQTRVPRSPQ